MKSVGALNKAIKKMKKGQYTLQELGLTEEDINVLSNNYNIKNQYDIIKNKRVYYIVEKDDLAYIVISGMEKNKRQEIKIMQLGDIHAGNKFFDAEGLRRTLKTAVDKGVKYVHIAGDLIDGHNMFRGQNFELDEITAEGQINLLINIFLDYDLYYIATKGNHDNSFCIDGSYNPLKVLELRMIEKGGHFTYLDSYEGNIVHCGVIFRLIHLAGANSRSKSYKVQTFIDNTLESSGNDCILGDKQYNIRSVQAGHFHTLYSFCIYGIDAGTTGNFKYDSGYVTRMGTKVTTGSIYKRFVFKNGQIIEEEQEYIF
ncbi:MAG: metallophosphoesterase [Clostridia bacterium]|nr:metallophosphoesterase [Clostridia bacterium]